MTTTNSDTAASQGTSASGTAASAGGTAANASASATAQTSGSSASAAAAAAASGAQLIVRPPLDVYKKLAIVRLPDDEVMYQNVDGSWGKVTNLDATRMANKKKEEEEEDGDKSDAKMSGEADDPKSSAEDADEEEKKDEEVSLADAILKVPNQLAGQYLCMFHLLRKGLGR